MSKGQDPEKRQNRDDCVAIMGDSMLKFIDARRLRNGTNKKTCSKNISRRKGR